MKNVTLGISVATATPPSYYPTKNSHRIGYAFLLFGGLINAIVAGTFLLKIVTDPYAEREIRSVDDILLNELRLVGDRFSLSQLYQRIEVNLMLSFVFIFFFLTSSKMLNLYSNIRFRNWKTSRFLIIWIFI